MSGPAGRSRGAGVVPALLPLLAFLVAGAWGIDFGHHWDEPVMLNLVQAHLRTCSLLPFGFYNYPSLCYDLCIATAVPDRLASRSAPDPPANLHWRVGSRAFHLRLRLLFLTLSSLTILWVYLLAHTWGRSVAEALLAACLLAFSWEVG
jgi:hypothetical protein